MESTSRTRDIPAPDSMLSDIHRANESFPSNTYQNIDSPGLQASNTPLEN